jgi:hypothetical protein
MSSTASWPSVVRSQPQNNASRAGLDGSQAPRLLWAMGNKILALLFCLFSMTVAAEARTLDDVRSSGVVTCGLNPSKPGFSQRDASLAWSGIYVDLCRAIAAAIFADPSRTNLVGLAPEERVIALQSGEIDVLMQTEPIHSGKDAGDGLMWVVPFLHEKNSGLASYAPVVRQGDDQWFQVVREVEFQLIRATTNGLTRAAAKAYLEESPDSDADATNLSLSPNWQMKVVAAAGNHAEILTRNLGEGADTGVNAVWSRGGLHWAPP